MGERAERLANALDPRIYTAKRYRRFVIRTRSSRVDTTHALPSPQEKARTRVGRWIYDEFSGKSNVNACVGERKGIVATSEILDEGESVEGRRRFRVGNTVSRGSGYFASCPWYTKQFELFVESSMKFLKDGARLRFKSYSIRPHIRITIRMKFWKIDKK